MSDRLLGRYRIGELLGRGAFATVHAAHDEQLDDQVAVKILAHNHAADPDMRGRFVAEGQVLRRLHSPHLIRVHDLAETEDGRPFLVLELCDRGTLRQRVADARGRGWTPVDADLVALAVPLAAAIQTMDTADIVHRDLTPANVLLTTAPPHPPDGSAFSELFGADDRLVVTDLGFCKDLAASTGITASGGTDGFRPPEQQTVGGVVDVRSDLWAASAILVSSLTGQQALTPAAAADAMVDAGFSRALSRAVARGLEADPDRRYPTPDAWLTALTSTADLERVAAPATIIPTDDGTRAAPEEDEDQDAPDRVHGATMAGMAAALVVLAVLANSITGSLRPDLAAGDTGSLDGVLADEDVSGLSLADLDDLESAAQQQEDPEVLAATPTPTPTPTGPPPGFEEREGGTWQFHLTTADGWEYDVEAVVDIAYKFGKDTTDSPPGEARFTSAVHGGTTATFTPTIEGRVAPEVRGSTMTAHFGTFDTDSPIGADPCVGEALMGSRAEDPRAFSCILDYRTTVTGTPNVSLFRHDEAAIDAFLTALDGGAVQYYSMSLPGRCQVWLLPESRVMRSTSSPMHERCIISGEAVVTDAGESPAS